jgi:hypothetical protein
MPVHLSRIRIAAPRHPKSPSFNNLTTHQLQ